MLIGLVGFIGSGKGTVGDLLSLRGFEKDSFAKPLKDAVSMIFGWPRELLEGDTDKSRMWREKPDPFWSQKFGKDFTPRLALQLMGTEAGRDVFHRDIWALSLINRTSGRNVVVTDVRFQNEIDLIMRNGGKVVRIVRGEDPEWYRPLTEIVTFEKRKKFMDQYGVHQSEWDWVGSYFDKIIINDGTLDTLDQKVDNMLIEFGYHGRSVNQSENN